MVKNEFIRCVAYSQTSCSEMGLNTKLPVNRNNPFTEHGCSVEVPRELLKHAPESEVIHFMIQEAMVGLGREIERQFQRMPDRVRVVVSIDLDRSVLRNSGGSQ